MKANFFKCAYIEATFVNAHLRKPRDMGRVRGSERGREMGGREKKGYRGRRERGGWK
jgi:hypothetical protein